MTGPEHYEHALYLLDVGEEARAQVHALLAVAAATAGAYCLPADGSTARAWTAVITTKARR